MMGLLLQAFDLDKCAFPTQLASGFCQLYICRHRNMVQHRKPCDCFGHYHFDAVTCSLRLVCQHLISVGMKLKNVTQMETFALKVKASPFQVF